MRRPFVWIGAAGAAVLAAVAIWRALSAPSTLDEAAFAARYSEPLPPPGRAMQVYHLGHSLVGRDMPAMVAQLAAAAGYPEHGYHSQLGWGASLDQHWRGEVPGFAEENAHDRHCPVRAALTSGGYDAVVLTEMVELRDAIRWHDSARALADWARAARGGRRDVRVYLYETWHRLDDPAGWLARIDTDRGALWEGVLLRQAMARKGVGTVHVIPAGQVMAALVRAIEAGEVPGLSRRQDLFAVTPEGVPDPIHLNDIGAYAVALTHVAVLYGQSPEGLPHALLRADGTPATAPGPEAAAAMQRLVWRMVTGYRLAGVTR